MSSSSADLGGPATTGYGGLRLAVLEQHAAPDAVLVPRPTELEAELPYGAVGAERLCRGEARLVGRVEQVGVRVVRARPHELRVVRRRCGEGDGHALRVEPVLVDRDLPCS